MLSGINVAALRQPRTARCLDPKNVRRLFGSGMHVSRMLCLPNVAPFRGVWMALVVAAGCVFPTIASGVDLSVAWVSRDPAIEYVWKSSDPTREGWPEPGKTVKWVAHVRASGTSSAGTAAYQWRLDGEVVGDGTLDWVPDDYATVSMEWAWDRVRHELEFVVDPDDELDEPEERNNSLKTWTDALAVGFYVERSYWQRMTEVVSGLGVGCATFDDWAQKRIRQFNEMAAMAVSDLAPNGVLDRWRLDEVVIVDDGALPLTPPGEEGVAAPPDQWDILLPNVADRTVDLVWGFPARTSSWISEDRWILFYDSLLHELGHARYLVDVYAWRVDVSEVAGDVVPFDAPKIFDTTYHSTAEWGLMNQHFGFIDRYSAVAMNLIAGRRAVSGNYNEPLNLGSFLNDLPQQNVVRVIGPDGVPIPNADVKIYQASGKTGKGLYPKLYDSKADLVLRTGSDGTVMVGRNPFSNGPVKLELDESNVVAIVEVSGGNDRHWGYLESLEFNLAYWKGHTDLAEHDLVVGAPICSPSVRPYPDSPHVEALVSGREVTFSWTDRRNADRYELWIAVDGGEPRRVAERSKGQKNVSLDVPGGRVAWWVRGDFGDCRDRRSPTMFFDHVVPKQVRARPVRRR